MKSSFFFFLFFLFIGCTSRNIPIVDYNSKSYNDFDRDISFVKQLKSQTVYILNRRIVEYAKFEELVNKNKLKDIIVIQDSIKIKEMGYNFNKTKKIVILEKK